MIRTFRAWIAAVMGLILAAPVFWLALIFWTVAWLVQLIASRIEPVTLRWPQLKEFDPELGWRARPNLKAYQQADDIFDFVTDAQGMRGRCSLAESKIVVFGDSFAAGYGIDDKDFFANVDVDLRIKTIGMNGYSMVQPLMLMERYAPQLRGKLLVWFIYYGNDLYENLSPDMQGYRAPFLRERNGTGEWEIVTHHISAERWPLCGRERVHGLHCHARLAELCSETFLAQRAYAACEFLIRKGRDIGESAGARLAVVTIPDLTQLSEKGRQSLLARGGDPKTFDVDYPDRMIGRMCRELGVPFVATKESMDASYFKPRDCHWNRKGNRRIAEILADIYREHGLELQRTSPVRSASVAER